MKTNQFKKAVLAIFPNTTGFGYVVMTGARELTDYGAVRVRPVSNQVSIERIQKIIKFVQPVLVVLQDPDGKAGRTGKRVKNLILEIVKYVQDQGLTVNQYSRDQIRIVFENFGAVTKYEIMKVLLSEFSHLNHIVPPKRKLWMSEDRNMAVFDALSLLTCYYYFQ
jgi:hypothetical protein